MKAKAMDWRWEINPLVLLWAFGSRWLRLNLVWYLLGSTGSKLLSAWLVFAGLFLLFLGHRYYKSQLFLFGFILSSTLFYIVVVLAITNISNEGTSQRPFKTIKNQMLHFLFLFSGCNHCNSCGCCGWGGLGDHLGQVRKSLRARLFIRFYPRLFVRLHSLVHPIR